MAISRVRERERVASDAALLVWCNEWSHYPTTSKKQRPVARRQWTARTTSTVRVWDPITHGTRGAAIAGGITYGLAGQRGAQTAAVQSLRPHCSLTRSCRSTRRERDASAGTRTPPHQESRTCSTNTTTSTETPCLLLLPPLCYPAPPPPPPHLGILLSSPSCRLSALTPTRLACHERSTDTSTRIRP